MQTVIAGALTAAVIATSAHAGGPVVGVEDPPVVVEEGSPSSKGILPWLMVPLVLCIVMCGPEEEAD